MSRRRLGVLISGRGSNLAALIAACAGPGFPAEIVVVISNQPAAAGLGRATAAGIEAGVVDHRDHADRPAFEAAVSEVLLAHGVELVCLAGFMRLLTAGFLDAWAARVINIHPSLLPAFKGLEAHARVLGAGVRITGCTVHYVVPEMDSGPIVAQAAVAVLAGDDEAALAARVLEAEHRLYPLAVRRIAEGRARLVDGRVLLDGTDAPPPSLFNPSDV